MRIYLDCNATTPMLPEAADAMAAALREIYGNASSIHAFGQQAKAAIDDARSAVARLIGAEPGDVVFTSGGTEADNLAIRGAALAPSAAKRRGLVSTAIEHEAVLNTLKALGRQGWPVSFVPVGPDGVVSVAAVREALTDGTALLSVMHANNEVGTIQPVAEAAALAREQGVLVHVDAVQSAGKIPLDVRSLGADLVSLSAHKLGGPKGIGALWIRRGVTLQAVQTGGRQERGRRAGTENVPAIVGFGVAADAARRALDDRGARIAALRDRFEQGLLTSVPGTAVNGDPARRVPNTSNVSFEGVEAESLLIALDLDGIAASTGSACSSGTLEPSHVLRAMGLPARRVQSALRFSLGTGTTESEIDRVLEVVPRVVARLRSVSRSRA